MENGNTTEVKTTKDEREGERRSANEMRGRCTQDSDSLVADRADKTLALSIINTSSHIQASLMMSSSCLWEVTSAEASQILVRTSLSSSQPSARPLVSYWSTVLPPWPHRVGQGVQYSNPRPCPSLINAYGLSLSIHRPRSMFFTEMKECEGSRKFILTQYIMKHDV